MGRKKKKNKRRKPSPRRHTPTPSPPPMSLTTFVPSPVQTKFAALRETPKILLSRLAHDKMVQYVDQCPVEIGWLGSVEDLGNRTYLIEDVFLFTQEVSGTTTILDSDDLARFAQSILDGQLPGYEFDPADGIPDSAIDLYNSIRFWGHSHVQMATNPSGQDDRTMIDVFEEATVPYAIRGIANKKGDFRFDVYYYNDGFKYLECPWDFEPVATNPTLAAEIKDEIAAKVRRHTTTFSGINRGVHTSTRTVGVRTAARIPHTAAAKKAQTSSPLTGLDFRSEEARKLYPWNIPATSA